MNLCIDIGNTRVKIAVFDQLGHCVEQQVLNAFDIQTIDSLRTKWSIKKLILASTATLQKAWLSFLEEGVEQFIRLSDALSLPISNHYASPKTLGNDRLSVAVGAHHLFPQENILVVDTGTCITYDFVQAGGIYHGGAILPGIEMRFKSMAAFTDKLPQVEAKWPDSFIGNTTQTSMQSGVMNGVLHELRGFKAQYQQCFGELKLIITGGDASYFESQLKNEIFAEPKLVLIGLNKILEYNSK